MGGFAALSPPDGREPDRAMLGDAGSRLRHRGPDDGGLLVEPGIGFAFRRLSIGDLATGHQPLANDDGTCAIVFNGEGYNHAELRPELIRRGYRYRTPGGTETARHAYEGSRG